MNSSIKKIFILSTVFMVACVYEKEEKLSLVLDCAQENRQELEKVLEHYKNDSLKLAAAHFLILNMPYHYTLDQYYISPQNERLNYDITMFDNLKNAVNFIDSLEREGYQLEYEIKPDIKTIDSKFLIENIDLAFAVREKIWVKDVMFSDFCKYILPYRAQTEKVSLLRKEIMERFIPLLDSAKVKTSLDACIVLNNKLKDVMKYGHTGLPFYPTIDETYQFGIGQCEGLCNLGTFIMRACGIPVAVDFTIWTKMDLGHYWCAVLDDDKFYSFGPSEEQPKEHARKFTEIRHLHPSKVYRRSFEPYVSYMEAKDDGYITDLKSPLITDVTDEYLDKTTEFKIKINEEYENTSTQIYLCAFNYYEWCPIAIGYRKDSIGYFGNLIGDNIFIIADASQKGRLRIISDPLYVSSNGEVSKLTPDLGNRISFTFDKMKNKSDVKHTLHYWDTDKKKFVRIESTSSTDTTQIYNQIPSDALLWFTITEQILNQRIFIIQNDSMKIY